MSASMTSGADLRALMAQAEAQIASARGDGMPVLLVTRHPGALAWLRSQGIDGPDVAQLDLSLLARPHRIIGVLPVILAAEAHAAGHVVDVIALPAIALGQRGAELTPDEMDAAGARLVRIVHLDVTEVAR